MNDSWFISMLTEIDSTSNWGYEGGVHGNDIVQVVLQLRTNGRADQSCVDVYRHVITIFKHSSKSVHEMIKSKSCAWIQKVVWK